MNDVLYARKLYISYLLDDPAGQDMYVTLPKYAFLGYVTITKLKFCRQYYVNIMFVFVCMYIYVL